MAILSEKKACPIAERMTLELSFEKSGLKRKCIPSSEPGIENEQMPNMAMIISNIGIMSLEYLSMPPCTPRTMTQWHISITATMHTSGNQGEAVNCVK